MAFAGGIALYFALPFEPARWIAPWILMAFLIALRTSTGFFPLWSALVASITAVLGFIVVCERAHFVDHSVLSRSTPIIAIEGRVLEVEPSLSGVRVTLDHLRLPRLFNWRGGEEPVPERIRVSFDHMEKEVRTGERIAFRGGLFPPSPPFVAGDYDFARSAWFTGLGAFGFAVNAPVILSEGERPENFRESWFFALTKFRLFLYDRIVKSVEEGHFSEGAARITAALITGQQGGIPQAEMQAYRISGLAHIVSISGLHMSIVAGLIFVGVRTILAAIPFIALRYPIKKWTAAVAILVAFFYLLLAGSSPPAQRSFIMCFIVMLAVIFDRSALSLRTIGCAMIGVLIFSPEALIGPSFQMSFAAVYMMIAAYEVSGPKIRLWRMRHTGFFAGILLYLFGIATTTLVAGTATALYGAYHFNAYPVYSLLANLVAIPIVSFWVMPMAIIAALSAPFGIDPIFWRAMGAGVALVNEIALQIAAFPGSSVSLPSMPASSLIIASIGMAHLALWRGMRWRLSGVAWIAAALFLWAKTDQPDIIADVEGKLFAVKMEDGRLSFSSLVPARNARKAWARRNGQGEDYPKWSEGSLDCDAQGCVFSIRGRILAFPRRGEALQEDCARADIVIAAIPFGGSCPKASIVVDALDLRRKGTHALWLEEEGVRIKTIADDQGARLWRVYAETPPRRKGARPGDFGQ
ncbi:competence protein ComEC [Alphaproteobacteria bacterium]|nr:competence protein ComEC [Alphaproteobacteria bacterium]